jgi:hypothetical protein
MAESAETFLPVRRSVPALAVLVLSSAVLHGCGDRQPDRTAVIDLLPTQIDSWTRGDPAASYDRETIFEYINGAGEVYRSYAFDQVVVAVYNSAQGPEITVELFDMGNPADAYGVFSYAREQEETGIGGGYEQKGRVLCFWQDRYYTCIAAEERSDDSDRALLVFARAISERLPPPFSERFFHLHQSLNYHYYLARENILQLSDETDAVLARYTPGSTYLLLVRYGDENDAAAAASSFRQSYVPEAGESQTVETENGAFLLYRHRDRFLVVVLDAESESAAIGLFQTTLDGLIGPSD